jgi:hypothetical protein
LKHKHPAAAWRCGGVFVCLAKENKEEIKHIETKMEFYSKIL